MSGEEEPALVDLSPPPYRELTIASAVFGVLLGALLTAAFTYVALKLGFTLSGSTVAAILGFAVLRGAMGKGSIIENNINQTVASGINNASPGVAFTLPALFLSSAAVSSMVARSACSSAWFRLPCTPACDRPKLPGFSIADVSWLAAPSSRHE